ncbi:MAG: hypothetical protein JOZ08_21095 [Verrucomicrobia bacterium]|nr:hypothetical protein [Verrucomicrobiota bacterium]
MKLSSASLRKAADIQERIERLESELEQLLQGETAAKPVTPSLAATPRLTRRGRRARSTRAAALNGRGRGRRSTSPSGPLAPAVVRVLKSRGAPMGVSDILDGLLSNGYKFNSPEPKKNLFARIYRLKGVRQVGPGRFAAE